MDFARRSPVREGTAIFGAPSIPRPGEECERQAPFRVRQGTIPAMAGAVLLSFPPTFRLENTAMELNPRVPGQYVQLKAAESPDKVIFTFEGWSSGIPDEVITFGSLWENAAKVAQELVRQGLQPRDSVALFMRNHPEFIYGIIGASICGAVFVPIDPRQKGDKLRYQLAHAECKAVLTSTDLLPQLEEVLPQVPGLRLMLATQR